LAVEHGVVADHLHHLNGAHVHAPRHLGNDFLAHVADFILRIEEQRNHGRPLQRVPRDELVEFFQQRFREHVQKRTKGRRASDEMSQYRTLAATVKEPPCSAHLLAFALYPQSFYRSTSPNTISIVPMQATTSAIKRPSIIFGK